MTSMELTDKLLVAIALSHKAFMREIGTKEWIDVTGQCVVIDQDKYEYKIQES